MTLNQLICVWLIFIPKWIVSQRKISQDDFIGYIFIRLKVTMVFDKSISHIVMQGNNHNLSR